MPLPSNPLCNFRIIDSFSDTLTYRGITFPNGYRLATVEEVTNNLDTIKRSFKLLQDGRMLLLDGYISVPGWRLQHTILPEDLYHYYRWRVVVKEKEWDEDARIWKKKCSACYSSNGILLRKHVYDGITLSPQGRNAALLLAVHRKQTEVIYWLFKTTNPIEFEDFRNNFSSRRLSGSYYIKMVESMFACKFPLQLPLEWDNEGKTALDYAISFLRVYIDCSVLSIHIVELLIEVYSVVIVHSEHLTDGKSFLDTATQNEWIPVLTKLLSVSPHSPHNHMSKIKHRFGDVLIEAVEKGYRVLVDDLLELKDYTLQITTDVCLEVFRGAALKGYPRCLQKLLEELKKQVGHELHQDKQGKTLFHYAAESGNKEVFQILAAACEDEYREKKRDKCGRNFLHWAALNGQSDFCKECIDQWQLKVDAKDSWGQNSLHYSAKGNYGHRAVDILIGASSLDLIYSMDPKGRTPLHIAAAKANLKMVSKLLSVVADNPSQLKRYIEQPDGFGRTALQMAAGGGHKKIVQLLLDKGCDPLKERDIHGSTALHYATRAKDEEAAVAVSQCLLNNYRNSTDKKSLLLWASAAGIGTAQEREDVHPHVKDFLLREKERNKAHLLRAAAENDNVEMVWELLKRGANIKHIYDPEWRRRLKPKSRNNVETVISQIEKEKDRGRDKPSSDDNLGRNVFAEGLAALFLNKFIESPITVGISGEWGMGKSSLMIQTENILLMAASQLTFPNLLHFENFEGAEKISLNTKGREIYRKIQNGVRKLLPRGTDASGSNPLVELLSKYHPQYHAIYKSLACMDLPNQTRNSNVEASALESQPLRGVPRILCIRYNAWHYRDEHEAWAGLAVTISNEIEQAMTRAQKFSTSWKYSWAKNSANICLQIFLPCLLATFLAGWVAWAAWTLLRDAKFKDLKYGSVPCTIIAIVWVVLKSVISVVKPVSTQMMGYITSPDHTSRLGYQQQVISDINFLKGELGKRPNWFFSLLSGELCWNWLGLHPENVGNTCVPKFAPASHEQLRIITFVDDLDRCEEKVILQVLSAINLVLAECKINVILGIDKKMIERAIKRTFEDAEDQDLADKFICKIIQIPLSLPDPTDEESNSFLQHHLRWQPPVTTTTAAIEEDGADTDYGELDSDNDVAEEDVGEGSRPDYGELDSDNDVAEEEDVGEGSRPESAVVDVNIDGSNGQRTNCPSIIKKLFHWLGHLFQILCLLAGHLLSGIRNMSDDCCHGIIKRVFHCLEHYFQNLCLLAGKLLSGLRQMQDGSNDGEEALLAFSRGSRLMREMLLSNYSETEAETFYKLKRFATGHQKLPREWKRLFHYHILAWNILYRIGNVHNLVGWRVELVAWIFLCWQWKHEMNSIFKGWYKYTVAGSSSSQDEDGRHGPSLGKIIENCVEELQKAAQQSRRSSKKSRREAILKLKGPSWKQETPFLCLDGHYENISEQGQSKNNWSTLQSALKIQDVSMKGIQLFQQFRLHCETDHLPWPLPEQNEQIQDFEESRVEEMDPQDEDLQEYINSSVRTILSSHPAFKNRSRRRRTSFTRIHQ